MRGELEKRMNAGGFVQVQSAGLINSVKTIIDIEQIVEDGTEVSSLSCWDKVTPLKVVRCLMEEVVFRCGGRL